MVDTIEVPRIFSPLSVKVTETNQQNGNRQHQGFADQFKEEGKNPPGKHKHPGSGDTEVLQEHTRREDGLDTRKGEEDQGVDGDNVESEGWKKKLIDIIV